MSDVMIQVEGLSKNYGLTKAVDGVSFNVRKGEILGFLGPNGAGKSTTMKILTCSVAPTRGQAKVAGFDVFDQSYQARQRIGYLPEDTPLYRDMTVREFLCFVADVRGMAAGDRDRRIKEIGGRCGLADVAGKLIGELSKGYRQRVGLAQAMLHNPDVVILDEPTSGLDPNQIAEIRALIKEIGQEKTVILSTHILPEVQATCSRIVIINQGKIVADGTPDELRLRAQGGRYRVVVESNGVPYESIKERLGRLTGVVRLDALADEDGAHGFSIDAEGSEDLRKTLFRTAVDNRWTLLELARESASLEDVFRTLTKGDKAPT
jgi:ABC-2 type transport system ATP-binding protein